MDAKEGGDDYDSELWVLAKTAVERLFIDLQTKKETERDLFGIHVIEWRKISLNRKKLLDETRRRDERADERRGESFSTETKSRRTNLGRERKDLIFFYFS